MTIRKMFADLATALRTAHIEADDRGEVVRLWRLPKKDGTMRFDVLYLHETPKGDGWKMLREVAPDPEADDER